MNKSYNIQKYKATMYYNSVEFFHNNKIKFFICAFFLLIGILTGVFTAIKIFNTNDIQMFQAFNLTTTIKNLENLSSNFIERFFSCQIVLLILLAFSQLSFLYVFSFTLIAYRGFLISINCVVIILKFSFSGILRSVLVILPCQLFMLFVMIVYFCYTSNEARCRKRYNERGLKNIIKPFLFATLVLAIINLIETLLLFIFKSSVILVV